MSKNISNIVYINLERRKDRKDEIEKELKSLYLPFERYNAIEHENGAVGCSYSHLNVLKIAKERGYKNVLILEDDFTFDVSREEFETNLSYLFGNAGYADFDVCMLTYLMVRSENIGEDATIGKVIEASNAAGYLIQSHYYQILIDLWELNAPYLQRTGSHWIYACDQLWKHLQKRDKWYYFKTRMGKQRAGYSDIGKKYVEN